MCLISNYSGLKLEGYIEIFESRWLELWKISALAKAHKSSVIAVQLWRMNNVIVTKIWAGVTLPLSSPALTLCLADTHFLARILSSPQGLGLHRAKSNVGLHWMSVITALDLSGHTATSFDSLSRQLWMLESCMRQNQATECVLVGDIHFCWSSLLLVPSVKPSLATLPAEASASATLYCWVALESSGFVLICAVQFSPV